MLSLVRRRLLSTTTSTSVAAAAAAATTRAMAHTKAAAAAPPVALPRGFGWTSQQAAVEALLPEGLVDTLNANRASALGVAQDQQQPSARTKPEGVSMEDWVQGEQQRVADRARARVKTQLLADTTLTQLSQGWEKIKALADTELHIYNLLFGVNPPYPGAFFDLPNEVVTRRLKYLFPTMLKPPQVDASSRRPHHGMKNQLTDRPTSLAHFTGQPAINDKLFELDAIYDRLSRDAYPPVRAAQHLHAFTGSMLSANMFAVEGARALDGAKLPSRQNENCMDEVVFRAALDIDRVLTPALNDTVLGIPQLLQAHLDSLAAAEKPADATPASLLYQLFLAPSALPGNAHQVTILRGLVIEQLRVRQSDRSVRAGHNPFVVLDRGTLVPVTFTDASAGSEEPKLLRITDEVLLGTAESSVLPCEPTLYDVLMAVAHRAALLFPSFEAFPSITHDGKLTYEAARWHVATHLGEEGARAFDHVVDQISLAVPFGPRDGSWQEPAAEYRALAATGAAGVPSTSLLQRIASATPHSVLVRARPRTPTTGWLRREALEQQLSMPLSMAMHRRVTLRLTKIARLPNGHIVSNYLNDHRESRRASSARAGERKAHPGNSVVTSGRRKASVAVVRLTRSANVDGTITVNGQPLGKYFNVPVPIRTAILPLELTGTLGFFNVNATVKGGGLTGHAGAIREGIMQGIIRFFPEFRPLFRKTGLLTLDRRKVECKKPGRKKARRAFQWVKR